VTRSLNVREVLRRLSDPNRVNGPEYRQVSVRMLPRTYAKLSILCVRRGTTASAFLRECAEALVAGDGDDADEEAKDSV
jgi:hypothetical protein